MINLAIFASGGGSNAESIIQYFKEIEDVNVSLILSNKKDAYVHERALSYKIPSFTFPYKSFKAGDDILKVLNEFKVDYIILAGFLLLISKPLTDKYSNRILNIHPALLPAYGGKGMYGHHVHQAVFDNYEKQSGMTIHLVNEKYDEGEILFQQSVDLLPTDTPDLIGKKVLALEHQFYPEVIHQYILKSKS